MRPSRVLTVTALVACTSTAGLVALVGPAAAGPAAGPATGLRAATDVTWCDATPTPPCIESATVDDPGTPGVVDVETDPGWDVSATAFTVESTRYVSVDLMRADAEGFSYELGPDSLDDVVAGEVLTGDLVPRVVTGKARGTSVLRAGSGSAHEVTVTGTPVVVSGQCDQTSWPWTCPEFSGTGDDPEEWIGTFGFQVDDQGTWEDAAQRNAFYGMNYFTNVAATSVPPEIVEDAATGNPMLLVRLANRHFRSDGVTVVKGHGELRIPNAFLKEVYGIPDPATMTGTSLTPSLSGSGPGTVTSAQEPGDKAMLVTYDDVEFSARKLQVRTGRIRPARPTDVSAIRTADRRGIVDFEASRARGAMVTGYTAECDAVRGGHGFGVASNDTESIARFSGLRPGVAYDCRVRASSKAGPSKWSETVRMPARPAVG